MSPLLLGAVAVAVGGVLAVVIGWRVHLLDRCGVEAILRRKLDQANARADALTAELGSVKVDLAIADQAVTDLQVQVAEALRIIAALSDARIDDADDPFRGQWVAPTPQAWATFQEGPERAGEN